VPTNNRRYGDAFRYFLKPCLDKSPLHIGLESLVNVGNSKLIKLNALAC